MRFACVAVAMTALDISCAFADDSASHQLQGETPKNRVGQDHLATPLRTLPIRFRLNGSAADNRRWWVNSEKLCPRWQTWLDGKTYCFTLRQEGRVVHWVRNDGLSGKATIVR